MTDETKQSPAEEMAAADRRGQLPAPGEVIRDKYRLDAVVGEGGFGRVYRATEVGTGRTVAIKMLKGTRAKLAQRFKREARAIAGLTSPSTLTLFDYGEFGSALFMVTEYVDGEDLSQLLNHRSLSEDELVHVLLQVLASLAEAHANGILHRDIKPPNIRLFEYANDPFRVKVLDFGLAKALDGSEARLTSTGAVIGTPKYMSPEQITGGALTPATDIFSLGVVAFECLLGGMHPMLVDIGQRLLGIRLTEDHHVSPGLRAIINRMLMPDVNARYQNADEVTRALRLLRSGPQPAVEATLSSVAPAIPRVTHAQPRRAPAPPQPAEPSGTSRHAKTAIFVTGLTAVTLAAGFLASRPTPPPVSGPATSNVNALLTTRATKPAPVEATVGDAPCSLPFTGFGYIRERGTALDFESWYTYIPPNLDPTVPHPLVLLFHQQGHTGEILLAQGGFQQVADKYGLIVVGPTESDFSAWAPQHEHIDKVVYMMDEVASQLCIDRTRTLAVGHGSGAGVAASLGCREHVSAVATHAYSLHPTDIVCGGEWKVPYLMLYPTKSGYEPVVGGKTCSGAERLGLRELEDFWLKRLDCDRATEADTPDGGTNCWQHHCSQVPLEVCHVDGGHGWSGTEVRPIFVRINDCDGPEPTFPMAERIGEFFDRTVLRQAATQPRKQ